MSFTKFYKGHLKDILIISYLDFTSRAKNLKQFEFVDSRTERVPGDTRRRSVGESNC